MAESSETSDPLILAIETATRAGGVAVARGESLLTSRRGDEAVSHSTNLIEMIEQSLQEAGAKLSEVDLFAVAVGPGSFTGLRIGLATVKAFAVHLNRKVVGVSTLAAVAHASGASGEVVSLLPAGRGEVFAQQFMVEQGRVTSVDDARHLSPSAVMEKYGEVERLTLAGEGAQTIEKFGALSSSETPKSWIVIGQKFNLAASIAILGLRAWREGKSVTPDTLHAVYVRASDAEINEQWQRQRAQQPAKA